MLGSRCRSIGGRMERLDYQHYRRARIPARFRQGGKLPLNDSGYGGLRMDMAPRERQITTVEELDALYDKPAGASLVKEIDHISDHYRTFIQKAPFMVLATSGPGGLDCSPRGDPAGFVRVLDRKRVLIPDRRGNNRLDSLHNLIEDPRVSLLFLIPGVNETLRINGRARIIVDEELAA